MVISENPTSTRRWTFPSVQVLTSVGSHWFRGNLKLNCATMAILPLHLRASETRFGFGFLYSSAYLSRELPTLLPPTRYGIFVVEAEQRTAPTLPSMI